MFRDYILVTPVHATISIFTKFKDPAHHILLERSNSNKIGATSLSSPKKLDENPHEKSNVNKHRDTPGLVKKDTCRVCSTSSRISVANHARGELIQNALERHHVSELNRGTVNIVAERNRHVDRGHSAHSNISKNFATYKTFAGSLRPSPPVCTETI